MPSAALQLQADLPGAWQGIGSALQNMGQLDEAIEAFRQEIHVAPDKDQAHFLLAEALFQRQEFAEAKACYQRAVQLQPLNRRAYYGLMKVCSRLEQPDEAAKYAAQFRRLDAGVDEAVQLYQELVQLEPNNAAHYQQLGFLQARLGNLAAAEDSLKRMVAVAPQQAASYRALAKLYLNTGQQAATARQLAATAVQLEPVADSYFVLGWAQAQTGQLPEALQAIDKAVGLEPQNATYRQLQDAIRKKQP